MVKNFSRAWPKGKYATHDSTSSSRPMGYSATLSLLLKRTQVCSFPRVSTLRDTRISLMIKRRLLMLDNSDNYGLTNKKELPKLRQRMTAMRKWTMRILTGTTSLSLSRLSFTTIKRCWPNRCWWTNMNRVSARNKKDSSVRFLKTKSCWTKKGKSHQSRTLKSKK